MTSFGLRDVEIETHLTRTIQSEFLYYSKSERAFIVSELEQNQSTGDTSNLHLKNPSESGVSAIFSLLQGAPSAPSLVTVYDQFSTAPSGGSTAEINNVLLDAAGGAPDSGEVTANTNVSFTESGTHTVKPEGGGRGSNAIGGSADMPVLSLEPGREIVLEVEKSETDGDYVGLTARWYEVPRVFSENGPDPKVDEATRP